MNYEFNDDTLIHCIGFDFYKLDSIFTHGIVSLKEAIKEEIKYTKNFDGYNGNDKVSMIRYLYVNPEINDSSYALYGKKGINLLVEGVPYIYDKGTTIIHRSDEVYVKNKVSKENITGIIVPEKYKDLDFESLPILPLYSTSYVNIKRQCDNIISYLKTMNYEVDEEEYVYNLRDLYEINELCSQGVTDDLKESFMYGIRDLNSFMGYSFKKCFSKYLGKEDITVMDVVEHINSKHNKLPIYNEPKEEIDLFI